MNPGCNNQRGKVTNESLVTRYLKALSCFITPTFECQETSLTEFTLALLAALRYLETERWISSLTVNSPFPHGTMTHTVSKHTVTFILWASNTAQFLQRTAQYYNTTIESSRNDQNFDNNSVMKLWINCVDFVVTACHVPHSHQSITAISALLNFGHVLLSREVWVAYVTAENSFHLNESLSDLPTERIHLKKPAFEIFPVIF